MILRTAALLAALPIFFAHSPAHVAPQNLGAVASATAIPLRPAAEGAIKGDKTLTASDILNQMINWILSRTLAECRYQLCREKTLVLRACLGNQHDILISGTT